jgi:hypothetical protein
MARLPALIDTLAARDTRGRPTVEHIARVVREAGFIQTTGRGRGAAEMTESDAASLIIGLNASESPGEAGDRVEIFRKLTPVVPHNMEAPPELKRVVAASNFGAAMEALILSANEIDNLKASSQESFAQMMADLEDPLSAVTGYSLRDLSFALKVTFAVPEPVAKISIRWTGIGRVPSSGAIDLSYWQSTGRTRKSKADDKQLDRAVTVAIGFRTIREVHRLLWPEEN